jgi:hypothetical protein
MLKNSFADPLREVVGQKRLLNVDLHAKEQFDRVFACAERMIPFHTMFLKELEKAYVFKVLLYCCINL